MWTILNRIPGTMCFVAAICYYWPRLCFGPLLSPHICLLWTYSFWLLSAWVMILIRREQYCSGPFMYQVMLLHHYVCLLHPCGVIEFYGPYVYVVLFCCCVAQGHQFFGYCFMYARFTTVLPSSKRSFALLFPVYTHNTP